MTAAHRLPLPRRAVVLLLLTAGLVLGAAVPSWASFTDTVAVSQSVATAEVAVPGTVASRTTCSGNTATVTLNWNASAAPRVTGYRVRLYLGNAWQEVTNLSATATTWQGSIDTYYVDNYSTTFTVWTFTEYGWTAESARTARITC